jgi:hypothetical protein
MHKTGIKLPDSFLVRLCQNQSSQEAAKLTRHNNPEAGLPVTTTNVNDGVMKNPVLLIGGRKPLNCMLLAYQLVR